jgi:hypothetical protein
LIHIIKIDQYINNQQTRGIIRRLAMSDPREKTIRTAFRTQAIGCRAMGSAFTATILATLAETLDHSTKTGARILDWSGDPMADALTLRIAGGLHALARSGRDPELSALYHALDGNFAATLSHILHNYDEWLYPWLNSPPQTNEVGRSGPLMAGLMVAAARLNMPFNLLELGASGGLNLNMDQFRFHLGETVIGPANASVVIKPEWDGPSPAGPMPVIASRSGVDQNPLDVTDPAIAAQLTAYCWADQHDRLARLEAAIGTAIAYPVHVEAADAGAWITAQLAEPQPESHARIIYHSVFWQYLPVATQQAITTRIEAAGALATPDHPLAWLRFEPDPPAISPMQLRLRLWPGDEDLHLASCHPHGARVQWFGPAC